MKGVDAGKGEECGVNFMGIAWEALSDVTMKTYLKLSKSQRGFCTEGSRKDLPCGRLQVTAGKAGLR